MKEKQMALAGKMRNSDPTKVKAFIGFDGFIDTVVHPVDTRTGPDTYERILTIEDYGKKFLAAAGLSMNIEMVPHNSKLGGIALILANSLSLLGFDMTYIGALGKENIHPVFKKFAARAHAYSISDPAQSDAIEFMDGKVISSKLEPLKDVNWDSLMQIMTPADVAGIMDQSDLIAFGGWTLSINVTSIWKGILKEVFPLLKNNTKREMFFDLSDPAKRTKEDILDALDCVRAYREKFTVGMGFNEKESYEIAALYGREKSSFESVPEVAEFIKEQVGLAYVVVHPVRTACGVSDTEKASIDGPYCAKPKLTTGAGDNFNAGFLLGHMMGFSLEESLLMGTANSGFYVRNARSATYPELCDFMQQWGEGKVTA